MKKLDEIEKEMEGIREGKMRTAALDLIREKIKGDRPVGAYSYNVDVELSFIEYKELEKLVKPLHIDFKSGGNRVIIVENMEHYASTKIPAKEVIRLMDLLR